MASRHRMEVTQRREKAQKRGPTAPKVKQSNPKARRVVNRRSRQERMAEGRAMATAQHRKEREIGIHPKYIHPFAKRMLAPSEVEWERQSHEYDRTPFAPSTDGETR